MAAQLPVIKDFVLVFTALFSIVNPIGSAFLFLEATRSRTPQQRNDLAKKVAVYAFFIMICSILIGAYVRGVMRAAAEKWPCTQQTAP